MLDATQPSGAAGERPATGATSRQHGRGEGDDRQRRRAAGPLSAAVSGLDDERRRLQVGDLYRRPCERAVNLRPDDRRITAGAPDVVPLSDLILAAATRVAVSTQTDRHLVVVLGSTPTVDLGALAPVLENASIALHIVAPDGVDLIGLAELAAASGGVVPTVPELVGESTAATAAIAQRQRIQATVDGPGPRELALLVDGARHTATIDVQPPPPQPAVVAPTTTVVAPTTVADEGGGSAGTILVVGALVALALAGVALWMSLRRRGEEQPSATAPEQKTRAVEREPVVAVVETPVANVPPPPPPPRAQVAAPARPRRAAPVPAPLPEPVVDVAEETEEWLVSGNLRLCRSTGEDPEAVLTQLRRKTRGGGQTRRVRKERVMLYFFDNDDD